VGVPEVCSVETIAESQNTMEEEDHSAVKQNAPCCSLVFVGMEKVQDVTFQTWFQSSQSSYNRMS